MASATLFISLAVRYIPIRVSNLLMEARKALGKLGALTHKNVSGGGLGGA